MAKYIASNDPNVKLFLTMRSTGLLSANRTDHPNGDIEWQFVFSEGASRPIGAVVTEIDRLGAALLNAEALITDVGGTQRGKGQNEWTFEIVEFAAVRQRIRSIAPVTFMASGGSLNMPAQYSSSPFTIEDMQFTRIPDGGTIIEPYVGYRDFDVLAKDDIYDPSLISRNGLLWNPYEPMIATCNGNIFAKHDAPNEDCECGIYAFDSPSHHDLKPSSNIWGEVYLWGTVFVCLSGYRAQYAYPKTLFVRDVGTELVKRFATNLEKAYGVPVHLLDTRSGQTAGEIMEQHLSKLLGPAQEDDDDA